MKRIPVLLGALLLVTCLGCNTPPATPPAPPPDQQQSDEARTRELAQALADPSPQKQQEALKHLASDPPAKLGAVEWLCKDATDADVSRRNPALDALEKAAPKLFRPVRILVTTQDAQQWYDSLSDIAILGEDGKPARPVLAQMRKRAEEIARRDPGRFNDGTDGLAVLNKLGDRATALGCISASLTTLSAISADEPSTVGELKQYLSFTLPPIKDQETETAFRMMLLQNRDVRRAAILGLKTLATRTPGLRAEVAGILSDELAKGDHRVEIIGALAECRELAGGTIRTTIHNLRYESDAGVQQAVDAAVNKIDGHLKAAEVIGKLGAKPAAVDLCELAAGSDDGLVREKVGETLHKLDPQLWRVYRELTELERRCRDRGYVPGSTEFGNRRAFWVEQSLTKLQARPGDAAAVLVLFERLRRLYPDEVKYGDQGYIPDYKAEEMKKEYPELGGSIRDYPDLAWEFAFVECAARLFPDDAAVREATYACFRKLCKQLSGRAITPYDAEKIGAGPRSAYRAWKNPHVGPVLARHEQCQKFLFTLTKRSAVYQRHTDGTYAGDGELPLPPGTIWAEMAEQVIKADPKLIDKAMEVYQTLYKEENRAYGFGSERETADKVTQAKEQFLKACRQGKESSAK